MNQPESYGKWLGGPLFFFPCLFAAEKNSSQKFSVQKVVGAMLGVWFYDKRFVGGMLRCLAIFGTKTFRS